MTKCTPSITSSIRSLCFRKTLLPFALWLLQRTPDASSNPTLSMRCDQHHCHLPLFLLHHHLHSRALQMEYQVLLYCPQINIMITRFLHRHNCCNRCNIADLLIFYLSVRSGLWRTWRWGLLSAAKAEGCGIPLAVLCSTRLIASVNGAMTSAPPTWPAASVSKRLPRQRAARRTVAATHAGLPDVTGRDHASAHQSSRHRLSLR